MTGEKIQQKTNKCKNDACFPEEIGGEGGGSGIVGGTGFDLLGSYEIKLWLTLAEQFLTLGLKY